MSLIIKGMEVPSCCALCDLEHWDEDSYGDEMNHRCAIFYKGYTAKVRETGRLPDCPLVPLPEKHGELIDRKRLDLVPDYKDVRNGIKRIIKETKRDGRAIAGISIELLVQTLVALDELRSVRRYFLNTKTIVPAECGADMRETGR